MQRLCSQFYIENYFRGAFAAKVINLSKLSIVSTNGNNPTHSGEIKSYKQYLAGATVLGSVDIPHLVNGLHRGGTVTKLEYATAEIGDLALTGDTEKAKPLRGPEGQDSEGFSSGLFVMEKGPFLRGKIVDDTAMEMVAPELAPTLAEGSRKHIVARNLGDRMAFDALFRTMREQGMFDWSPDGLVLSKLESPSGDPFGSAELDARQAQLFNIAVQGPAITKTWTGNPLMHAMPLDKVFVVVVADVSSTISDTPTDGTGVDGALMKAMWDAYAKMNKSVGEDKDENTKAYNDAHEAVMSALRDFVKPGGVSPYAKAWTDFVQAHHDSASNSSANTDKSKELITKLEEARTELKSFTDTTITETAFDKVAFEVKSGKKGVKDSCMTNFRLMRVTSSFLSNTSAVRINKTTNRVDASSRCGLKLGKNGNTYTAEYIIGGWCVGTVLDSAASRSVSHNQVRTAPASMAMNINVNVEWMSGDDLYRRYMDIDSTVQQRGIITNEEGAFQKLRDVGLDVNPSARREAKSVQPY